MKYFVKFNSPPILSYWGHLFNTLLILEIGGLTLVSRLFPSMFGFQVVWTTDFFLLLWVKSKEYIEFKSCRKFGLYSQQPPSPIEKFRSIWEWEDENVGCWWWCIWFNGGCWIFRVCRTLTRWARIGERVNNPKCWQCLIFYFICCFRHWTNLLIVLFNVNFTLCTLMLYFGRPLDYL